MSQDKRILRATKACETLAGLQKWCFVYTEYQLVQHTEIIVFESVDSVGANDVLLSFILFLSLSLSLLVFL